MSISSVCLGSDELIMIKTDAAPPNAEHEFFLETGGLWSPYNFPLHHPRFIENIYVSVDVNRTSRKDLFFSKYTYPISLKKVTYSKINVFLNGVLSAERWSEFVFIKMAENASSSL